MFDFTNPETLWLNVTNLSLGAVTLVCLVAVGRALYQETVERLRNKSLATAKESGHALYVSELGLTMADGGEKVKKESGNDAPGSNPGRN